MSLAAAAGQTLVTGLFDLESRERGGRRPVEAYVEHLEALVEVPLPLVLYADPHVLEVASLGRLLARRPPHLTTLVPRALEALPRYGTVETFDARLPFANADPRKDTPLYLLVGWSKLDLLRETIAANPHHTSHFAWVDAGIGHVAVRPPSFPAPVDGVAFLQMCAVAPCEVASRPAFYAQECGRLAGGFFRGSGGRLEALAQAFDAELDAALACGTRPNDQMVLSRLSVVRSDLFEVYYGDYSSVLCNWDAIRDGVDTVLINLAHCRQHQLWATSARICEALEAAHRASPLDPELEIRWRDEHLVAAWHAGDPEGARRAGVGLMARAETAWFRRHEERLRANLRFVDL